MSSSFFHAWLSSLVLFTQRDAEKSAQSLEELRSERLCEEVCWHLVSWTVIYVHRPTLDVLLDEEEPQVHVLEAAVVLGVLGDLDYPETERAMSTQFE